MGYTRALVLFAIFKSMTLKPVVHWVKTNKLAALVILVLSVLLYTVSGAPSGSNPVTNGIGGVPELGEGAVSDKGGTGASGGGTMRFGPNIGSEAQPAKTNSNAARIKLILFTALSFFQPVLQAFFRGFPVLSQ